MGVLEGKVDDLRNTCTKIETGLDGMKELIETKFENLATKAYVLRWFGITILALGVTLVGHLLIRSLAAG